MMNSLIHDSGEQENGQANPLDAMLRRFFHAEMPQPWPVCRVPTRPGQLPRPASNGRDRR